MNNRPIFLISTGRTGTKFFSRFFPEYCNDVASYHTSRFTRLLNILGNMYYFNIIPEKKMGIVWKHLKYKTIASHTSRYIENNPYYYNCINIIKRLFPETKIIWIVRHPKSFIISHIKWERQRLKSRVANYLIPFWQPVSYKEQLQGLHYYYYQRVEVYSKVWLRKNQTIAGSLKKNDNYYLIKFEEVFNPHNGISSLTTLLDWLGLPLVKPLPQNLLEHKVNSSSSSEQKWDEKCERIMRNHCKTMMDRLGY